MALPVMPLKKQPQALPPKPMMPQVKPGVVPQAAPTRGALPPPVTPPQGAAGKPASGGIPASLTPTGVGGLGGQATGGANYKPPAQPGAPVMPGFQGVLGGGQLGVSKDATQKGGQETQQEKQQSGQGLPPSMGLDPSKIEFPDKEGLWAGFEDILAQHEAGLAGELEQADLSSARSARRASEMSGAQFGGGGFQAGLAQQGLAGQEMRMQAQREHNKQGIELKMTWLQQQLQSAEAQKDRELEQYLREEMMRLQGQLALVDQETALITAEADAAALAAR